MALNSFSVESILASIGASKRKLKKSLYGIECENLPEEITKDQAEELNLIPGDENTDASGADGSGTDTSIQQDERGTDLKAEGSTESAKLKTKKTRRLKWSYEDEEGNPVDPETVTPEEDAAASAPAEEEPAPAPSAEGTPAEGEGTEGGVTVEPTGDGGVELTLPEEVVEAIVAKVDDGETPEEEVEQTETDLAEVTARAEGTVESMYLAISLSNRYANEGIGSAMKTGAKAVANFAKTVVAHITLAIKRLWAFFRGTLSKIAATLVGKDDIPGDTTAKVRVPGLSRKEFESKVTSLDGTVTAGLGEATDTKASDYGKYFISGSARSHLDAVKKGDGKLIAVLNDAIKKAKSEANKPNAEEALANLRKYSKIASETTKYSIATAQAAVAFARAAKKSGKEDKK